MDLGRTQLLFEEPVNGGAAFALANPEDTGAVQVVHNGGESAARQIGKLIDAHCDKSPNPGTGPCPGDDPVKEVRQCGGRHPQNRRRRFLRHDLA